MTVVPDGGTPAEAITAVTDMIEDRYDGTICQRDYDVLSAAAPVIAARAAAAQLAADIKLADDVDAIARCLADVEDFPESEHYALADDVLLALRNAGFRIIGRDHPMTVPDGDTTTYVCPDCLCTRDTYCDDDQCKCHGPRITGPISKAALTELVETTTAMTRAVQAYEPEATGAVIASPKHLFSVLLEASRRAVDAAAPVIAARAAAAQRDADIKLADERKAVYVVWHKDIRRYRQYPFADLLAAAPDTTTGKETR